MINIMNTMEASKYISEIISKVDISNLPRADEPTFQHFIQSGVFLSSTDSYAATFISFGENYVRPNTLEFSMSLAQASLGNWKAHDCFYGEFNFADEPKVVKVKFSTETKGGNFVIKSNKADISSFADSTYGFAIALCTVFTPTGTFTETPNSHSISINLGQEVVATNRMYVQRMSRLSEQIEISSTVDDGLKISFKDTFATTDSLILAASGDSFLSLSVDGGVKTDSCDVKVNGKETGKATLTTTPEGSEGTAYAVATITANNGNILSNDEKKTTIECYKTRVKSNIGIVPNLMVVTTGSGASLTSSQAFVSSASTFAVALSAVAVVSSVLTFLF